MLAAGCALKSRFWCTTQQKVRLKLAFLTPQKRPKKCAFFKTLPCRMAVAVRGTKTERPNPTGSQMACRPVVFCEPQQPTGRWEGGLEVSL